jgi:hypothetical protein
MFNLMGRFPRALSIGLADGRTLDVRAESHARGQHVRVRPVARIEPRFFDACPVCGDDPTEAEHVPPQSIGGRVMTRTCAPCNHKLGSNVEADLVDWHDGALTLPRFSAPVVAGARRSSRILYRLASDGSFVLFVDGTGDAAVREMFESGQVDLQALWPDTNRSRLGLLKHAFLAACLHAGPLNGPDVDAVRADLIAARDAEGRRAVPPSSVALGLTVVRAADGRILDWPVVRAFAEVDGHHIEGVVLGGTTFVSWSWSSDAATRSRQQAPLHVSLDVAGRMDGLIHSTDD